MSKQYTIPEILSAEIEALRTIPQDNDYEAAICLILEHVHQGGGRLITSGMVAEVVFRQLINRAGTPGVFF